MKNFKSLAVIRSQSHTNQTLQDLNLYTSALGFVSFFFKVLIEVDKVFKKKKLQLPITYNSYVIKLFVWKIVSQTTEMVTIIL